LLSQTKNVLSGRPSKKLRLEVVIQRLPLSEVKHTATQLEDIQVAAACHQLGEVPDILHHIVAPIIGIVVIIPA